jgi:hypothetical protein
MNPLTDTFLVCLAATTLILVLVLELVLEFAPVISGHTTKSAQSRRPKPIPCSVAPMAFDPEPSTVARNPVAVNPSVGPHGRALVIARNPFVSVVMPSPMARDPSVVTPLWRWTGRFGYEGRRGVGGINPGY